MATEMAGMLAARGRVVLGGGGDQPRSQHEIACHSAIARQLADLLGMEFAGPFGGRESLRGPTYFVPEDVLVGLDAAAACGIHAQTDLFGGVVPYPVVANKSISHPCIREEAYAPPGWSWDFARRVEPVTLPGYSAFDLEDARRAGAALLADGPVRVKLAHANAGRGQFVASDPAALERIIADLDAGEVRRYGVVIEADLVGPVTHSVGQVRVGDQTIAYYGHQWLTRDNQDEPVYGGSQLTVFRGDLGRLLRQPALPAAVRPAVAMAHAYDQAARDCLHGMFASRRNYDVAEGVDHRGQRRMGVLESSWRIGGASSAEVAALVRLRDEPARDWLRARSVELYGRSPPLPAGARILYQGDDPDTGPITVCTVVEDHGHT